MPVDLWKSPFGRAGENPWITESLRSLLPTDFLPFPTGSTGSTTVTRLVIRLPQIYVSDPQNSGKSRPRPCLFNQQELIDEREKRGVYQVRPGITGLAQVQGIDMSAPQLLAETDCKMVESMRLSDYFRYIFLTVLGNGAGDRVG